MTTKKKTPKKPAAKATTPDTPAKVLVLRACNADGTSYNGFRWPTSGPVEAPDWKPTKKCGNGLHGLLWGVGDYSLVPRETGSRYLVVEVDAADVIDLGGKVKFPRGVVVFTSLNWWEALIYVKERRPAGMAEKIATGDYGHAAATGYSGHAAATGYSGHAAATGDYGHAAATGDSGHAAATGYYGHAAALSYNGKAKAGTNGAVVLAWCDGKRGRFLVGYVGEDGIEADTWYRVVDGKMEKVAA